MGPLVSLHQNCAYDPHNFCHLRQNDFFNTIRQKRPFTQSPYFHIRQQKQKATRALHRMAFETVPLGPPEIPSRGA